VRRARIRDPVRAVHGTEEITMIRKLQSGEYRLYSIKKDAKTGRRRNLGTFKTLEAAKQHEREVQYFKRH
jgi:ribosomal protein L19E